MGDFEWRKQREIWSLAELQDEFGGDDFEVVTIATGRNPLPAIDRFFDEIDVDNLPKYLDARSALGRDAGVFGLLTEFGLCLS